MSKASLAETAKGILTDVTLCIGCERCVEACSRQNKLPSDVPAHHKAKDGLSSSRFTSIVRIPGRSKDSFRSIRRQCMHCVEPACRAACLVGAFIKTPDGAVEYDQEKCIGCRYCMLACPFLIPRYEYEKPLPYVRKCKMNQDCRVEGGQPACVTACPTGATIFGPRKKLIEIAHKRIARTPDRYLNHIYGEKEFGGTSVMYIGDISLHKVLKMPSTEDFQRLRVPELAEKSIPSRLHGWVMVTPFQFLTVSAGLAGLWIIRRRMKLANQPDEAAQKSQEHGKIKSKGSS